MDKDYPALWAAVMMTRNSEQKDEYVIESFRKFHAVALELMAAERQTSQAASLQVKQALKGPSDVAKERESVTRTIRGSGAGDDV